MRVAIVICTWNRATLLDNTLAGLRDLHIPKGVTWDVVVVNNNCTDNTDEVIAHHQGCLPIRGLHERQPGKSFAANLAITETNSDLLVWTDDDVLVDRNWLAEYIAAATQWPEAAFFGGTIEPHFSIEPPFWIRQNLPVLSSPYAVLQLGDEVRQLGASETPFGANLAIRREVLEKHRFDTRLGPSGTSEIRGEEAELIHRLRKLGHRGVWVGTAKVKHWIPPERLTEEYIWKYFHGYGRTQVRTCLAHTSKRLFGAPRWAWKRYWLRSLAALCLRPFKTRSWVESIRAAATARGIIDEARSAALSQCLPDMT
jgi:glycosyltransferase involved in cell wall biosynthesis